MSPVDDKQQLRKLAMAVKKLKADKEALSAQLHAATAEPIAVIGLSCRLPAGSNSPEAFGDALFAGRDGVVPIPEDRWDREAWYDPDPMTPGRTHCREGGFIDDADLFDAAFFDMSPKEAESLDPQHRLLLMTAWHALEDAGFAPDRLKASATGVYIGISSA
ncbi:MAG: beta-ketoacyl synthase N-terminal-like domain-containing protein, partial [Rhodospirillaceae bacterium]